ncbi:MAG TPA: energy transducer TonB [Candidatus Limnocylindria bacterium]|nr:energy transducer TonB [Candidatus Limnocylindria bacterium]
MRKVYHAEKSSTGLVLAVFLGAGVTAVLFGIIPFSHIIAKPSSLVQLRQASTADLPPPVANEPPPMIAEPEKKEEAPPELKLADAPPQIALSADLEVATGTGGGLAGFGEVRALTAAQPIQEDAFDVADLEKRPEPVSQVAPSYPSELRKAKIEGTVMLTFLLTEEGRVEDPRVENSSRPEFEKPALEAIRKWRFRPGMKDGQTVRTYIRIPMRFRVSN